MTPILDSTDAACKKAVQEGRALPDDWFPEKGARGPQGITRLAIQICHECPIQVECREWALENAVSHYSLYGIWGGLTAYERKAVHMARRLNRSSV